MKVERTRFAYESLRAYLDEKGRDALVESFCVQYLLVSLYSEMEKLLSKVIEERLKEIEDEKVAVFISVTNDAMIRRVKKAEINDLLKKFGCDELIEAQIDDVNLQPYFDAIANRHFVTHGDGCNMTLDEFAKALPCADKILASVEQLIAA